MRRFKFSKIFVTVVLTLLIWVWADLALDEETSISNARIIVAKSVNPVFWVTFDGQPSIALDKVVFKGSARKIADARQQINQGKFIPEFYFDPAHEKMTEAGEHALNVANFLNESDKVQPLGLTVVSADPNRLTVKIVEMQKKQLVVRCYDENQNPLKTASIEPAQVEAYVPAEREGAALEAKVVLIRRENEQARLAAVEKTPFVELSPGQTREALSSVKITLPREEEHLSEYLITSIRLGISLSQNLQGKYKVELVNPEAVMGTVTIRATPEAKRAYDNMRYQVILDIDDSDLAAAPGTELRRQLVYNFPEAFVRSDGIMLNQAPVQARFKLIPIQDETPAPVEPMPIAPAG